MSDLQTADVNAEDKVVATTTEVSSTEENKESSVLTDQQKADAEIAKDLVEDEDKGESKDESKEETKEETKESSESKEEDTSESKEDTSESDAKGADARKQVLQSEIRELVSKRNELRGEVEQLNAKAYRTETPEELIDKGLSEEEAETEVLRQEMQIKDFNIKVADLNATLNIESLQVMQDFPMFDPDHPSFDPELSKTVGELYNKAAKPVVDKKTGLVIESNITPYDFYKAFADTSARISEKSKVTGQLEGQKAADKEIAAAEVQSSAAPKVAKEDAFLKGLLSSDE